MGQVWHPRGALRSQPAFPPPSPLSGGPQCGPLSLEEAGRSSPDAVQGVASLPRPHLDSGKVLPGPQKQGECDFPWSWDLPLPLPGSPSPFPWALLPGSSGSSPATWGSGSAARPPGRGRRVGETECLPCPGTRWSRCPAAGRWRNPLPPRPAPRTLSWAGLGSAQVGAAAGPMTAVPLPGRARAGSLPPPGGKACGPRAASPLPLDEPGGKASPACPCNSSPGFQVMFLTA